MLLLTCDTGVVNELIGRLERARREVAALRHAVEAGEPWPLSTDYGAEPESSWGPKEVLAHVAEMLPFWLGQFEAVLADDSGPAPFGRVATDPARIARIGSDRNVPTGELFDRIDAESATVVARLRTLTPDDTARLGRHPRLGEMTLGEAAERFVVGHLEEHVEQLREVLAAPRQQPGP